MPDDIYGSPVHGLAFDDDVRLAAATKAMFPPRGIFGEYPGATPKYARNYGEREPDFRETMARLFLQVKDYKAFIASFPQERELTAIATVLGGTDPGSAGVAGGGGYIDFILQSAQHNLQEKMQVVETLSDDHVAYFFGQAAPTFAYGGTLINTQQDDQAMNMLRLYSNFGRGTVLAKANRVISLRYDGLIVSGPMINLSFSQTAETEMAVPFSFNILVKRLTIIPNGRSGLVQLQTPFATKDETGFTPFVSTQLPAGLAQAAARMVPRETAKIAPAATAAAGLAEQTRKNDEADKKTIDEMRDNVVAESGNVATLPREERLAVLGLTE